MRWVNRWLGGRRALLSRFKEFARNWNRDEPITVLDVGTGTADLPGALQRWASKRNYDLSIVAVDIDPKVLRFAREEEPEILFCRADVHRLCFGEGSFDYVVSSMFFHHLSDLEVIRALRSFDRIARRGIVINDLLRRRRAWLWIKFLTLPCNHILRTDGPLSVRKGFRVREIERVAREAGVGYLTARVHFGHRFTLAGQKPQNPVPR